MKKIIYIFLFFTTVLSAQEEIDCIEINFESIPGEATLFEGLSFSEQYRADFGIYFELETGGVPVLAEVGDPRTAFGSFWGGDTPAPGVDLGQFFLTDDGVLSGLTSPPIIIRFDVPVDTFSGCIMDMDFGEEFIIQARDIDDNILLADTIRAGDPNTGDGQQTCWGFNLPDCSGTIYSIRYEGKREQSGAFGLGLDNLTFCTGVDVPTQITTETTETVCGDFEAGSVVINNTGPGTFQYSLDGSPFQDEPFFTGLDAGDHLVILLSDQGCVESIPIFIDGPAMINFVDVGAANTTCEEENGSLLIATSLTNNVTYSIDGIEYQESPAFDSLAAGTYTVYAQDAFGCTFDDVATIAPSELPEIFSSEIWEDECSYGVGQIIVDAKLGSGGGVQYRLNDGPLQDDPGFMGLPAGEYMIQIVDEDGCVDERSVEIPFTPSIQNIQLTQSQPFCDVENGDESNGSITISASGGTGAFSYLLNDISPQTDNVYDDLPYGTYEITVVDEIGCLLRAQTSLEIPKCPLWIPNVFSPNNDDTNEYFSMGTVDGYELGIIRYMIFDRWGELVYDSYNFGVRDRVKYWNGRFNGRKATEGVYAYLIEVEHPNGDIDFLTGDVTLVR